MSLWFRDPPALRLNRAPPEVRGALLDPPDVSPPDAGRRAEQTLAAFGRRIDRCGLARGSTVCCWIGADVARVQLVPWQASLVSRNAAETFARHCFEQVYGTAASEWVVRLGETRFGQAALACAMENALLQGVRQLVSSRGLRLSGVRPLLMEGFNRARSRISSAPLGWLVLAESPWLTMLLLRHGKPIAVKSLAAPLAQLGRLIERESRALGLDDPGGKVWLIPCDDSAEARTAASPGRDLLANGWVLEALPPLCDAVDVLGGTP